MTYEGVLRTVLRCQSGEKDLLRCQRVPMRRLVFLALDVSAVIYGRHRAALAWPVSSAELVLVEALMVSFEPERRVPDTAALADTVAQSSQRLEREERTEGKKKQE